MLLKLRPLSVDKLLAASVDKTEASEPLLPISLEQKIQGLV